MDPVEVARKTRAWRVAALLACAAAVCAAGCNRGGSDEAEPAAPPSPQVPARRASRDAPAAGAASEDPSRSFSCTLVIGYSQVAEWYRAGGAFESTIGDDRWELLWNGGAGVDRWRNPDYEGWSEPLHSPCSSGSNAPDRVLLSISGPYGADETKWADAIAATVVAIRRKYPSVERIVLQPVVGGPGHRDCLVDGDRVRASWQHAHIDHAIAGVVNRVDVVAGLSPEVRSCADYRDALGHLTPAGATAAGGSIGAYYASAER